MIYLASPYSDPDPFVREERYLLACRMVARLLKSHKWVFSPIVHCHELKKIVDLPFEHEFWLEYDFHILERCSELHVLCIDGWQQSRGVKAEIEHAALKEIPVFYR